MEGKFYVWSRDEVMAVLGAEEGAFFCQVYDVTAEGNWEHANILNRLKTLQLRSQEDEGRLAAAREMLFHVRARRVPPGWDDKVLADWNGLAIAALIHAAETFGQPHWREAALQAYRFIKQSMQREGRLLHSYRAGKAHTPGVASDYANMIAAALRIHLATGEEAPLDDARAWTEVMNRHYWAEPGGGYYLSADDTGDIIIRMISARDDAVPNANAMMLSNLAALHLLTGDMAYQTRAQSLERALIEEALRMPSLHTGFLSGMLDVMVPQHVVLIRGAGEEAVRDALRHIALPGAVVQWLEPDADASPASPAYGKRCVGGQATAYICVGPQCSPPVTGAAEIVQALRDQRAAISS